MGKNTWFEKELVNEYVLSNFSSNREFSYDVMIDGRKYTKHGTETATTFYARVYKILGPSVEPSKKYLLLVGMSKQNPIDFKTDKELAVETAAEKSITDPIISIWSAYPMDFEDVHKITEVYYNVLDHELIMTKAERLNKKYEDDNRFFDNPKNEDFYFSIYSTPTDNNLDLLVEKYTDYPV